MKALATNRQKKVLRFFGVPFHEKITAGAAGWELGTIFADEANSDLWRKYLYLTQDFGSESDELAPYDPQSLEETQVPKDWSASGAIQAFREEIVAHILASESPFDTPQPDVTFYAIAFASQNYGDTVPFARFSQKRGQSLRLASVD